MKRVQTDHPTALLTEKSTLKKPSLNRVNNAIQLMTMKMKLKKKSKSKWYEINRPWPIEGYKYTKYKMCLSIIIVYILNNT